MKDYLFIAGCPRSGTSALVQLLSYSKEIVIGMERYGHLVSKKNFSLTKNHFIKERFFTMEKGDTFYDDVLSFHKFSPDIYEKYDEAKIVGDKRPNLYESYDELFDNFPDAKVIFIYRNIEQVASSYSVRAQEGSWPATKDFKQAVIEWNQSLYLTREALKKGFNIKVVDYETLYLTNHPLDNLFNFLNVKMDDKVTLGVNNIRKRSEQLKEERKMILSENELTYVMENAKKHLINEINGANLF